MGKNGKHRPTAALIAAFAVIAALCLGGCGPDWSRWAPYVSKTEVLTFGAIVPCRWMPPLINPVPTEVTFFQISNLRPVLENTWRLDADYVGSRGEVRHERLQIIQKWRMAGAQSDPSGTYNAALRCAVLVEFPRAEQSQRPFYLEDPRAKAIEYQNLIGMHRLIFVTLCLAFPLLLIPAAFGFEPAEMEPFGKWLVAASAAAAILLVCWIGGDIALTESWRRFQKAQAYYAFFDALPRGSNGLLPIPTADFYRLLAGPPLPSETRFAFPELAWTMAVLASLWLVALALPVIKGIYWIATPLPLEQAHRQALHKGRRLTAEEIVTAMNKAVAGKSAWQLNIMRRKAEAFARTFGYVANHNL